MPIDIAVAAGQSKSKMSSPNTGSRPASNLSAHHEALLDIGDLVCSYRDVQSLMHHLAARLRKVVSFDYVLLVLYDPAIDKMRLHLLELLVPPGTEPLGSTEIAVEEGPAGWVMENQKHLIFDALETVTQFPAVVARLKALSVKACCYLPLTTPQQRLGAISFGSVTDHRFPESSMPFLQRVANQVAIALDNARNFDAAREYQEKLARERDRLQLLLDSSNALITHLDLEELFAEISGCLRRLFRHDMTTIALYDAQDKRLKLNAVDFPGGKGVIQDNSDIPLEESPAGIAFRERRPVLRRRIDPSMFSTPVINAIKAEGLASGCVVPLMIHGTPIGTLGLASVREEAFNESDVELITQIAGQVAIAVENARNFELAKTYREKLAAERDRLRLLLEINNAIASNLESRDLFQAIFSSLRSVIPHDLSVVTIYDEATRQVTYYAIDSGGRPRKSFVVEGHSVSLDESRSNQTLILEQKPILSTRMDPSTASKFALSEGLKSGCSVPLVIRGKSIGVLHIGSFQEAAFTTTDLELLEQIAGQVAISVENALSYKQIEELKDKLTEEKLYLEDEIRSEYLDDIVGESAPLRSVLEQIQTVAQTDATVLILGETGTGKELIARALHLESPRQSRTFVKLNCSAIPTGLLESELFGHEKGAFTGAIAQKIGRLELADKGTLFLDEIGDIPLELQPKLLRALQEREFERLGSTRTIKVDVRLVAATNRDLAEMVANREFRSDLYYRLNVFPIQVPPLRERADDIPRLVRHFVSKYAQRLNRNIESIPANTLKALQQWHWPGNVRELENFIERAVILTRGSVLNAPVSELRSSAAPPASVVTLEDSERDHILKVLRETRGVLSGPTGAAERLGLKRSTLQGKMKRLGISRNDWLPT
jgi:formate hydrogenlyase transcriptional activator